MACVEEKSNQKELEKTLDSFEGMQVNEEMRYHEKELLDNAHFVNEYLKTKHGRVFFFYKSEIYHSDLGNCSDFKINFSVFSLFLP